LGMRYWTMLPDGGVKGPLEAAKVAEIEAFGPETLVCPEHYGGDGDHAWIRAGFVGELRSRLPRALRLIPPDPTLREAAAVRSVEERVLELEEILLGALERLRERTRDVRDLELESKEREREVLRMRTALKKVSSRVGGLGRLEIKLKRMTDALESKEQSVGAIRNSFEQGLEEAARMAAESVAEAHSVIREAARIAEKAIERAEKATAAVKKQKKTRRIRRKKRKRSEKKTDGPDPFDFS